MRIFNVFTLTDANIDAPTLLCCHLKETTTRFFLLYLQGIFYFSHLSDFSLNPPIKSNQILLTAPLKGAFKRCVLVFQVFVDPNREIHNESNSLGAVCRKGLRWADKPEPRAVKISISMCHNSWDRKGNENDLWDRFFRLKILEIHKTLNYIKFQNEGCGHSCFTYLISHVKNNFLV